MGTELMKRFFSPFLVIRIAALSGAAFGGDPANFDPTGYIQNQEFEESRAQAEQQVTPTNVTVNGTPYIKFESASGAILLPKVTDLREEDLDRALCSSSFKESELQSASVAATELNLTRQTRLYAQLIVDRIQRTCDGSEPKPPATQVRPAQLEVGAAKKGASKDPTTYTIFNRNLQPNVGVRADF